MHGIGILALLHFAAVIYALIKIVDSGVEATDKILWVIVVALFPLAGLVVWYLKGPGSPRN